LRPPHVVRGREERRAGRGEHDRVQPQGRRAVRLRQRRDQAGRRGRAEAGRPGDRREGEGRLGDPGRRAHGRQGGRDPQPAPTTRTAGPRTGGWSAGQAPERPGCAKYGSPSHGGERRAQGPSTFPPGVERKAYGGARELYRFLVPGVLWGRGDRVAAWRDKGGKHAT